MSKAFNIIIDRGISAPGHGREVVDGLNTTDKSYLSLKGHCTIITSTHNAYVNLAQEFQKHLSNASRNHGIIDY